MYWDHVQQALIQLAVVVALIIPISLVSRWWQKRQLKKLSANPPPPPPPPYWVTGQRSGCGPMPPMSPMSPLLKRMNRTEERELLLEPNKFSEVKIEKYALGFEFVLNLGSPCLLKGTISPDVHFRCSLFQANVPCSNFARVTDFYVANVGCICVGGARGSSAADVSVDPAGTEMKTVYCEPGGAIDLWNFREPVALIDTPTAAPANKFTFNGVYDGNIPDGYKKGDTFRLSVMLAGYASITA
jgi:hypothetical protein